MKRGSGKLAIYQKDTSDGELTDKTIKAFYASGDDSFTRVEMKEFMDKVHLVKINCELENMKIASRFVRWTCKNLIEEIENIIDSEKEIKHSQISNKVEKMLEKPEQIAKFLGSLPQKIDSSLLEYPLGLLIQSGSTFTINRLNVQSDQNKLNGETIYLNACGKYRDMNVMASRTLLVNPDDTQKQTYIIANEALEVLMQNLVVGEPVNKAFTATKEFLKSKDAQLAGKTHTNFGFGVRTT